MSALEARSVLLLAVTLLAAKASIAAAPTGQVQSVETQAGPVAVEELATGLVHPWALAFLPDGRALVTERPGRLRVLGVDGALSDPVSGTPPVFAKGQGGLLDVALHPDFASNRLVYLSFAEPAAANAEGGGASTALGRGRLSGDRIEGFQVIFSQQPKVPGPNHFGGRIVFDGEGHVFLTLGERFKFDPAQDLSSHLGTVVRLRHDGTVPPDNPFTDHENALGEIFSYGHRNVESAAFDPGTGQLWIAEMGPLGGDELNAPKAGRNYGWPVVSRGRHYSGEAIPAPSTHPRLADAALHWTPVISPSGMVFYDGDMFPEWRGSLLIGSLTDSSVVRVAPEGETAREVERVPLGARIRDVAQAADGSLYVLTDQANGKVWRITPLDAS